MAGATPGEMDFLQLYDDYPIVELIQLAELGYTEPDEGGEFLERTDFAHDGDLPVNTGGGQLCVGQAGVGGAAFVQVLEAVRQLRGDAGDRQLEGATVGLTHNVGGSGGAAVVHLFEREASASGRSSGERNEPRDEREVAE